MRTLHRSSVALGLVTALTLVTACGDDSGTDLTADEVGQSTEPSSEQQPEPDPAAGEGVAVVGADSDLGRILVDPDGMTLYAFVNDADGQSSCSGTCAEAWPPLTVGSNWDVGPELDSAIYNTHTRDDGSEQLVVGQWPLYTFSEDAAPGDLKGQGSGGVWFVVSAEDGSLIRDEVDDTEAADGTEAAEDAAASGAAELQAGQTELGEVLTDVGGRTLYAFTDDTDGVPSCDSECAGYAWSPLLTEGEPDLAEGLDPAKFAVADGAEGGTQVVAGDWPLYTFSGDDEPGDVNGHGSNGAWYAVSPDGSLIGR